MILKIKTAADSPKYQKVVFDVLEAIQDTEAAARRYRREREEFLANLRAITNQTLKLGVAVVDETLGHACSQYVNMSLLDYLSKVLQDNGQPVITLVKDEGYVADNHAYQGRSWTSFHRLKIPKNSRLKNLASGLLLLAENAASSDEKNIVVHEYHDRSWQFLFMHNNNKKGEEVLNHWLKQCAEDPIFRVCLGLPYLQR